MTLTLVCRLYGLVGLLGAISIWFGIDMMAASYGWEVTLPMVTMSQLLVGTLLFNSVIFIMLPNWTSEEQLKKATVTLILLQIIAVALQVFSSYIGRYSIWRHAVLWNRFKFIIYYSFLLEIKIIVYLF